MVAPTLIDSRIGLGYEYRRRLFKKLAVCISEDGGEVSLHVAKGQPTVTLQASDLGAPAAVLPATLSPAGRLWLAASLSQINAWDVTLLTSVLGTATATVATSRQLADEALLGGWGDAFQGVQLTASEKAWRAAHHAAAVGDVAAMHACLSRLPAAGYAERVALVFPYVVQIATDRDEWEPVVRSWVDADLPRADVVHSLLFGDHAGGAAASALSLLAKSADPDRVEAWRSALDALAAGAPTAPMAQPSPRWSAADVYMRGMAGTVIDGSLATVSGLDPALLDDMIDAGALTSAADVRPLDDERRRYVSARVAPGRLSDDELRAVGHVAEQARRAYVRRQDGELSTLPAGPDVAHYGALLDVLAGREPDLERLRPEEGKLLRTCREFVSAVEAGRAAQDDEQRFLPEELLADPSVWYLLAPLARSASLPPPAGATTQRFRSWCDLQRLLGLLFENRLDAAANLGQKLFDAGITAEIVSDEIGNLTAFALHQLGRHAEALEMINGALEGAYTESLLVNACIIAGEADPVRAAEIFARLVLEAPSVDLKVVALRRAIEVWTGSPSSEFPSALLGPLFAVLAGPCPFDDYCWLLRIAVSVAPAQVLTVGAPSGEAFGPYELAVIRAKWRSVDSYLHEQFARDLAGLYRRVGRPPWFELDLVAILEMFREATFVPFGEGYGSAVFWDTLYTQEPDLLTEFDKLVFLPQAGAHLATYFGERDGKLSDAALKKFFFVPAEQLISKASTFDDGLRSYLATNLAKTLFVATGQYVSRSRTELASLYNPLVDRLRWDQANRPAIRAQMRQVLDAGHEPLAQAERSLDRLHRLPSPDADRHEQIRGLQSMIAEWRAEIVDLRSNL